jgi:DNA-binding transcriptional MerR regulator
MHGNTSGNASDDTSTSGNTSGNTSGSASIDSKTVIALYKTREVVELLDLSRRQLQYWAKTGLIEPSARTPGGHHRYSFDDLVALKATKRLLDAGVSVQKIRKSVRALQTLLPKVGHPLSELVLVATGDVVLVFRENTVFEAVSGQEWVFEVAAFQREVAAYRNGAFAPNHGAAHRKPRDTERNGAKFAAPRPDAQEALPAKPGPRVTKRLDEDWSQTG